MTFSILDSPKADGTKEGRMLLHICHDLQEKAVNTMKQTQDLFGFRTYFLFSFPIFSVSYKNATVFCYFIKEIPKKCFY